MVPNNIQKVHLYTAMTEADDHRKARLALFARDAVKAKADYKDDMDAVKERTTKLRLERLERESIIRMPAPKTRARRTTP